MFKPESRPNLSEWMYQQRLSKLERKFEQDFPKWNILIEV